jgi:hypothetical protein
MTIQEIGNTIKKFRELKDITREYMSSKLKMILVIIQR